MRFDLCCSLTARSRHREAEQLNDGRHCMPSCPMPDPSSRRRCTDAGTEASSNRALRGSEYVSCRPYRDIPERAEHSGTFSKGKLQMPVLTWAARVVWKTVFARLWSRLRSMSRLARSTIAGAMSWKSSQLSISGRLLEFFHRAESAGSGRPAVLSLLKSAGLLDEIEGVSRRRSFARRR